MFYVGGLVIAASLRLDRRRCASPTSTHLLARMAKPCLYFEAAFGQRGRLDNERARLNGTLFNGELPHIRSL